MGFFFDMQLSTSRKEGSVAPFAGTPYGEAVRSPAIAEVSSGTH
jgi:hypothetical protein